MKHSIRTSPVARSAALALALATALTAIAQENAAAPSGGLPTAPPGMPAAEKITVLNNAAEQMRKFVWQAQTASFTAAKDSRGRTFKDDINEYLMPPAVSERVDQLAEQAKSQANDEAALNGTATEMETLLRGELAKMGVISTYWRGHFTLTHHRSLLEQWLTKASDSDRAAIQAHLATTEKAISDDLQTALTQDADAGYQTTLKMHGKLNEAASFYNGRRVAFANAQSAAPDAPPRRSRKREAPCEPSGEVGKGEHPALAAGNQAPEALYPPSSKQALVEGMVVMRVSVTETGCMEAAEVIATTGVAELDDAALLWAERAKYVPAAKDGKNVPGTFSYRVNFALK